MFFLISCFLVSFPILAQLPDIAQGSQYVSPEDANSTIRSISIAPGFDNANGIYARPLTEKLRMLIDSDHRFEVAKDATTSKTPDQLDDSAKLVMSALKDTNADALLTLKAVRTPSGMEFTLRMYRKSDGLLFIQGERRNIDKFAVEALNSELERFYTEFMRQLPYQARILSRKERKVTLNIGAKDGIKQGDTVTAIQIIGFRRHPKFRFIIHSTKQILGTVKVLKADEKLSFGEILSERALGAIEVNTKIETKKFVDYDESEGLIGDIPGFIGENTKEWVPEKPPSFGRLIAGFGLGRYNGVLNGIYTDTNANEVSRNITSNSSFVPSINLEGELWLTPLWLVRLGINQGIINTETDAGSQNISTSRFKFDLGYNLLFTDDFFGPKLGFALSVLNYNYSVDETGTDGLSSMRFDGVGLEISGSFPLSEKLSRYSIGGSFTTFLNTSAKETPRTSGSTTSESINAFSLDVGYKISQRIRLVTSLEFDMFQTKFNGSGSRNVGGQAISGESASQRYTTLVMNLHYLF